MHISSLPGRFGIGCFGPAAYRFADFLASAGYSAWQVLPLTPVSETLGNSPYSGISAFAVSSLFISPEKLAETGLINCSDYEMYRAGAGDRADYAFARRVKSELLHLAWMNFRGEPERFGRLREEFNSFCLAERLWLEDYALFYVLKETHGGARWSEWPREYKFRAPAALSSFLADKRKAKRMEYVQFVQFLLYRQWNDLRSYCNDRGVRLIGDVPMYVAFNSVDVWAGQEFFDLNDNGYPNKVAGVPPDYFSATGQYWGNPVFRWDVMRKTSFRWWVSRIKNSLALFDQIRIDHFRGFCRYWAIPAEEETAVNGCWETAPGREFFETLRQALANGESGALPLIAEDLGVITDDVRELMEEFDLPGMKVLLFAFDGCGDNAYLPHNHIPNAIVYTGTHDNNTANGWWSGASDRERSSLEAYAGTLVADGRADMILSRFALSSVARTAVLPVQDLLGLGEDARMNTPGEAKGCWEWRLTDAQLDELFSMAGELSRQNGIYGRR